MREPRLEADHVHRPRKRLRLDGHDQAGSLQPSSSGQTYSHSGSGNQISAPVGSQNNNFDGNQVNGSTFNAPVYFGAANRSDESRNRERCLQSLAFSDMDHRFDDIEDAAEETCEWLHAHSEFKRWASSDQGLLWIRGKPGSGKSTLLRHCMQRIETTFESQKEVLVLSFFFHGRGSDLQKTPLGFFRSLLYQLLDRIPNAMGELLKTFQRKCTEKTQPGDHLKWNSRQLQRLLRVSLEQVMKTHQLWIFVDALDECGEENAVNLVKEFKSLLQKRPRTSAKQLYICFSCRHYPNLELRGIGVDDAYEVRVEKENSNDIATFVRAELSFLRPPSSIDISDLITQRSNGIFMWARLVVKKLLDRERRAAGPSHEAIITSVPQELDDLYSSLIEEPFEWPSASRSLIEWVLFAVHPLPWDALRWAILVGHDSTYGTYKSLERCREAARRNGEWVLNFETMNTYIQTLSCGLVEVTPDTKMVQFIHQSVKDFFAKEGFLALIQKLNPSQKHLTWETVQGEAHYRLSRTCIRYVSMANVPAEQLLSLDGREAYAKTHSLIDYSTFFWTVHVKKSERMGRSQDDLLSYFDWPSHELIRKLASLHYILERASLRESRGTTLLHFAEEFSIFGPLRAMLVKGADVNVLDDEGLTPLLHAVEYGLSGQVGNSPDGDDDLLHSIKILLDAGATVTGTSIDGRTPLHYAARHGRTAIIQLLIDKGGQPDAASVTGLTPLHIAANCGHPDAVKMLVDEGATVDITDHRGLTPLHMAVLNRNGIIVKMLLEMGADVDAVAWVSGQTSLFSAVERQMDDMVKLLLNEGARVDVSDTSGRTPLDVAIKYQREPMIELLRQSDAEI